MGRLLLQTPLRARRVLLPATVLVGRHWSCHLVLDHPSVPLFWVELRWGGSRWMWRCLEGEERTVGAGACLDDRWRQLANRGAVRLSDGTVALTLVDDRPPVLLIEDLLTGALLEGDACLERVDIRDDGVVPLGGGPQGMMDDGQIFVQDGRPFRMHLPAGWQSTEAPRFSLATPGRALEWSLDHDTAVLTVGRASVTVTGEPARLLCVYAQARRDSDGWRTNGEALAAFVSLGGNPASTERRMNWERSRLRQRLREAGATGVDDLFSTRRYEGHTEHRLTWAWAAPETPD